MLKIFKLTGLLGFLLNVNTVSALAQPAYPIFEKEGFLFEFLGCNNTSNTDTPLKCEFRVENTREDRRNFYLFASESRVIDLEGNQIQGLTVNLGNREEGSQANTELVKGVPVKGSITFEKSPIEPIRLVDLRSSENRYPQTREAFNIEFPFIQP